VGTLQSRSDIGEANDLAKERPDLVRTPAARFERWNASVKTDATRSPSTRHQDAATEWQWLDAG
jgi:hypothetical protein